ncbi:helix-turn-helix domain-containing protein [Mucilaginibacter sp. L196]|uniref:helix-turn-helix domain-containing protein n=1 Tax=Mucilaginibacter sp. L196 TaxID=1641870 RepID=UPI00131E8B7F|nr:helix-turn-helix transcriptional regulator [Mucilaginibacter sp. L196]
MNDFSRSIIGKNVKSLRLSLGLSQLSFSILTGLSKPTIVNIESEKKGYNLNLLDKIIEFSDYSLSDLSSKDFILNTNIREELIEKYRSKRPEYYNILTQTPEIVYAIKNKLLVYDFIETPREIREIKKFFEKYGWNYKGTSISNALKRMPKLIQIKRHETKGNTNVYSKI